MARYKWCPWSDWGRCAPVNCYGGGRPQSTYLTKPFSADHSADGLGDSVDASSYCVVEPTVKSRKFIPNAAVQFTTSDNRILSRIPVRVRTRQCACTSVSLLNILGLYSPNQCAVGTEQVECFGCGADERIYRSPNDPPDAEPLPLCDPLSYGDFRLYKIFGGVAGGVVIVLFLAWLIRILIKTFSHSDSQRGSDVHRARFGCAARSSRADGRVISRSVSTGGRPAETMGPPLEHLQSTPPDRESPPAYKDVVGMLPPVHFADPSGFHQGGSQDDSASLSRFFRGLHKPANTQRFSYSYGDDEEAHRPGETFVGPPVPKSATPPPPSYEDIVSSGHLQGTRLVDITSRVSVGGGGGCSDGGPGSREPRVEGGGGGSATAETNVRFLCPSAPLSNQQPSVHPDSL
ncbi:hypothetical protein AHF37_09030 [Paragonimus kellicotti]|nr:hypothetical protein AHF37_09030 [Paragonimus kellicotti]